MKYGIYYAYWGEAWEEDFIPYVAKVKKLGFDILEVAGNQFQNTTLDYSVELGKAAKDNGIILTGGYGPDAAHSLSSADPQIVENAFAKYQDMFEKMEAADIHLLGGGLYSYWPADYSRPFDKAADWERSVKNMRKLADMAADHGILLGMEVLNRFEGYLLNTADEGIQYVKEVDKPNVKVMLDTFHMNIEEDSFEDAIHKTGSLLGHVHLGEANRRPPFAGGRMPWKEIGQALRDIGYDGTVVMEPFVKRGGKIGEDIRIWHDLKTNCSEEELDADAAASVAFVRKMFEGPQE